VEETQVLRVRGFNEHTRRDSVRHRHAGRGTNGNVRLFAAFIGRSPNTAVYVGC
jgi:hypothetical protein